MDGAGLGEGGGIQGAGPGLWGGTGPQWAWPGTWKAGGRDGVPLGKRAGLAQGAGGAEAV